jgi:thiosulfate/3-mercaptopyruvate sulfurtransferase
MDRRSPDPVVDVAALVASFAGPRPPTLLDVRWRPGGPRGRQDYAAGHLPGAVFLDLDTARGWWTLRWAGHEQVRVLDGGSGVTAALAVLALHRAGRTDAALYVGSWSHWVTDPGRPVAVGAGP